MSDAIKLPPSDFNMPPGVSSSDPPGCGDESACETVHYAIITHKHGTNLYFNKTRKGLIRTVAAYCREWWADYMDDDAPKPDDDDALVRAYFNATDEFGREWLETGETEVGE